MGVKRFKCAQAHGGRRGTLLLRTPPLAFFQLLGLALHRLQGGLLCRQHQLELRRPAGSGGRTHSGGGGGWGRAGPRQPLRLSLSLRASKA